MTVLALTPTGALDPTFGDGGVATAAFPGRDVSNANAIGVQSDGKILGVGAAGLNVPNYPTVTALARYLPNGALDPTFGTGGLATTTFDAGSTGGVFGASVRGCHVVAVGAWGYSKGVVQTNTVGVARYWL
jgi:uncharacterized delta-60 repeat protein